MVAKFTEQIFEDAFIELLHQHGWDYECGYDIHRSNRDVLLLDKLKAHIASQQADLTALDVDKIVAKLLHVGGQTHFDILRNITTLVRDGFTYVRTSDSKHFIIDFLNFDDVQANSFTVVNQFEVGYGLKADTRRPDILLFVNGIPLCILELKNPSDQNATITDAYEQIHTRYMRDIPHLLQYCPLSCISDGVKTRLGTTYSPYKHYYAWKKVNNDDHAAGFGVDELETLVAGAYATERFLEVLRDYVYFPDKDYEKEEEVVCRYPQFFATRKLRESVLKAVEAEDNKGGTYFGATGCGKTFTMMFLARQFACRCPELHSPTVIMIVDRDDLQTQAGQLFTRSKDFLALGTAVIIKDRKHLHDELSVRETGGFFICTIQKFCEGIGLLSERRNIICFSDEAHRTQVNMSKTLKIKGGGDEGESLGAFITKPYALQLRTAFPHATFVGFTGTPIDETIQVFGDIVDSYNMKQSVDDEITVPIGYIPRIAQVTVNQAQVQAIDAYYRICADEGATEEDISASKKAMSSMEMILGDEKRLERLAKDIADHYTKVCENKPGVVQKAMIVCSNRPIAYTLLKKFKKCRPDWFVERKSPDDSALSKEKLDNLKPMPTIAMVATRGKNDPKEMFDYLGDKDHRKDLEIQFKKENSNFKVVIVVDMWITGFDLECLTYLYNDKPLQKHTLIQTISRVNRKHEGKDKGYIIDYIGIHSNMMKAMKQYGGDSFGPSEDDVEQAREALIIVLDMLTQMMSGFDISPMKDINAAPFERYVCLSKAANYVLSMSRQFAIESGPNKTKNVSANTYFLGLVKRLRVAYDICQPSDVLTDEQLSLSQCFMAIAGFIHKVSGEKHDAESMNRHVAVMVEEALKCDSVLNILEKGQEEDIFDEGFIERLQNVKMPATRLEVLIKMLSKAINEYMRTNKIAAKKYKELLNKTLETYHDRKSHLTAEEAGETQEEAVSSIIKDAEQQALAIIKQLGEDRESFRKLGLSFEEKAFYDILLFLRDRYNFVYGTDHPGKGNDRCKALAKKIKELIDTKSSFADWLNNANIRKDLAFDIKVLLIKNGYPPQYSQAVFDQVMDQVENFKRYGNEDTDVAIESFAATPVQIEKSRSKIKFKFDIPSAQKFVNFLPFYTLRAACGKFGPTENVDEQERWVEVSGCGTLNENMFVVQAVGDSMDDDIHDGDLCIFRNYTTGHSYQGSIVLAQLNERDADYDGSYTIKRFFKDSKTDHDGYVYADSITLIPSNPAFRPIVIDGDPGKFMIIGELVKVI